MTRDKMSNSMLVQQFVIVGLSSFLHIYSSLHQGRETMCYQPWVPTMQFGGMYIFFKNNFDSGFGRNSPNCVLHSYESRTLSTGSGQNV